MKKYYKVQVLGTALNTIFYTREEPAIVSLPSSTYWKFIYVDGRIEMKNDFGVSSVSWVLADPKEVEKQ